MDQGRQGRDQVDTAVVQDVRGQRRAAPASCARLQSWQLSPHACNTGADQGLVADELEGEADQDRREGGEPRTLCRLPNGGGRHPTTNVPRDSAADRATTAAATTRASMKRSIVTRSRAIDKECVQMPVKIARSNPSTTVRAARAAGSQPHLASGSQGRCKIATLHAGFGVIRGMSVQVRLSQQTSFREVMMTATNDVAMTRRGVLASARAGASAEALGGAPAPARRRPSCSCTVPGTAAGAGGA